MIPLIPAEEVASISKWIPITKSYRYDMQPTKKQYIKAIRRLEVLRHLFNWSLGERKDGWENGGWRVTYKDQQDHLKRLRNGLDKENKDLGKELQEVYEQVEQNQLYRVDLGYQRFFERVENNKKNPKKYKKPGHPRFKGRDRMKSFTFPQYGYGCHIVDEYGNKDEKGDFIRLSGIGDVKFIKHAEIGDPGIPFLIKTVTIKREVDKWIFIPVIETFVEIEIPVNNNKDKDNNISKEIKTIEELKKELDLLNQKCVGNDMGLPNLINLSNGEKIEAPKYLEKSAKRLRKEQQKLSRKQIYDEIDENGNVKRDPKTGKKLWKGSKNRDKQVVKVAKVHRYIKNQRRNFDHNVSKESVKKHDLNVFEKLPIQKMMKDRRYSKGIADSGWSQVQRYTTYKAEWAGKKVDFVDPVNTSRVCSICGGLQPQNQCNRLKPIASCDSSGRLVGKTDGDIFHDPLCGFTINVHVGAGKNIRNRSPIYQQKLDEIYQRLSKEMKDLINTSEKRLRYNIYCWSLDPEDSWNDDKRISRDAAARIYAFGEVTSTLG